MIDAQIGQRAYRISYGGGLTTYYREIRVVRVTKAQILAETKLKQTVRFWRKDGYEVGGFHLAGFSSSLPTHGTVKEAGCDRGRSWND